MPLLSTERKSYTDVVKGTSDFENEAAVDYHFARVNCKGNTSIVPMGIPMVWVDANSAFEVFVAQNIPTVESDLPNGAPVCVVVGQKEGKGVNKADVTLTSVAQELTVLYRGAAAVAVGADGSGDGVDFGTASSAKKSYFSTSFTAPRRCSH